MPVGTGQLDVHEHEVPARTVLRRVPTPQGPERLLAGGEAGLQIEPVGVTKQGLEAGPIAGIVFDDGDSSAHDGTIYPVT